MVELLLMTPPILLMLAGIGFTGGLYGQKLATHGRSSEQAWQGALAGCEGEGEGALPAAQAAQLGPAAGLPGVQRLSEGGGEVTATDAARADGSGPLSALSSRVSTTTTLPCDERPQPGALEASVKAMWGKLEDPRVRR